jgi:hypothetical protein
LTSRAGTIFILLFMFFMTGTSLIAQQDSVQPGVMKVRRPPVPSTYYIDLSYSYSPARQNFLSHLFKRVNRNKMPLADDNSLHPPEPVTIPRRDGDTTNALRDSSFMIRFYEKEDRPASEFAWIDWLDQYEHYFQWNDTAGIDSAVFVYDVNPRGQVKFMPGADNGKDSSSTAMQKKLIPLMRKLWIWYPAVWVVDERGRQKKINCKVTVKIYAVRDDQQERMPLKVVD